MAPAYRFGKGFIVTSLEAFVANSSLATMRTWLDEVRKQAQDPTDLDTQFDTYLEAQNLDEYNHLLHDVFGFDRPGTNPLPADEQAEGKSRRKIYAEGLARVVEASYGIAHGAPIPDKPKRHWKLDVYWGCGQPANSVIVNTNDAAKEVVVHVFSTATPPGLNQAEQAKSLPKGATVVDDHLGLEMVDVWP
jgi:hypothetical protein